MFYSKKYNACIYPGDCPRVDACIPEAKTVIKQLSGFSELPYKVVPCTIKNMQNMAKLGYEALSPMLYEYDWPHAPIPGWMDMEHQRHMAAFSTLHPRCFNLSDMGTGKTLATLWAEDYLMQKGLVKKTLILAPLSTIYRVWENEIFTHFLGRRKHIVLYGSREKRIELLNQEADFYIINHDGLGIGLTRGSGGLVLGELAELVRTRSDINSIVVDEGSTYKASGTDKYKVLRKVIAEKPYVRWLTGTPTPTVPTEAYPQARVLRKNYTENFTSFRERTMDKVSMFKWIPRPDGYIKAAEILQPAIRYDLDDCVDLPDVIVETRDADLTSEQKKAIEELKKTLKTMVSGGQVNAVNEAALRTKLIQIACGAVYGAEHEVHKVSCTPRLQVLQEIIEQSHHKILIFVSLTSIVNMLYSELKKEYSVERITGDVSPAARNTIFKNFQEAKDPRIIIAHPECMAHGLTLTAASTIIWYGPTDKPEIYAQANKRIDRPGQKNKMLIIRIVGSKIEQEIYKRLDSRLSLQGVMLSMLES